ncbi:hypothetical protein C0J52_21584 [Blattella germanica]|nr:hypothetical protein C0J52_21584 [Blattella germanica]
MSKKKTSFTYCTIHYLGKFSFLNRTISDWNQLLPVATFEGGPLTVRRFKINLDRLL